MSESAVSQEQELLNTIRQLGGDPADLPFWQGCSDGRFLLHRCEVCGQHYWPASCCVEHGSENMQWVESSGRGELYTYTVMHRVLSPRFSDKAPYVVAVVKLEEGPFYHSNLLGCDLDQVRVGMPVEVEMVEHESGMTIPQFRVAP